MLNPATLTIFITTPKDSSFSMALLIVTAFAIRIYFTRGKWLEGIIHNIMFIAVLTAGTLFRHNGILFTLPMLLGVSLCIKKRHAFILLVCFIGMIYAVRYPLYDSLNVIRPDRRQIETIGVPMCMIGNAVKETPELLDKDILDFAYSIAPAKIWEETFNVLGGGFSGIKYVSNVTERNKSSKEELQKSVHINIIESVGYMEIIKMAFRCLRQSPFATLRGFCGLTSIVHSIAGPPLGRIVPVVAPNRLGIVDNKFLDLTVLYVKLKQLISSSGADDYQISQWGSGFRLTGFNDKGTFSVQSLVILYEYVIMVLFRHVFWCIGVLNLTVIIFILGKLNFNRKRGWKKLFLSLPMLVHNFGTMLLLAGSDFRYFYFSYLVTPLILLLLIRDDKEEAAQ